MNDTLENPITFDCLGHTLLGILHSGSPNAETGVVIVVGGGQYRVGAHRQFLLLARTLADAKYPVLRFDYRGMGDSVGETRSYLEIEDDIQAAVDVLFEKVKSLKRVVLWGLCDGASAAVAYAGTDKRVNAVVMLNPWIVESEQSLQIALLRYYWWRLKTPVFWKNLFSGRVRFSNILGKDNKKLEQASDHASGANKVERSADTAAVRVLDDMAKFRGPILTILSGGDRTAVEFESVLNRSRRGKKLKKKPSFVLKKLPEADHTLSREQWQTQMEQITLDWLKDEC